jgi:hypothetical protein
MTSRRATQRAAFYVDRRIWGFGKRVRLRARWKAACPVARHIKTRRRIKVLCKFGKQFLVAAKNDEILCFTFNIDIELDQYCAFDSLSFCLVRVMPFRGPLLLIIYL